MIPFPDNPLLKPAGPAVSKTDHLKNATQEIEGLRLKIHFYQREMEALKIIIIKQQEQIMDLELRLRAQSSGAQKNS